MASAPKFGLFSAKGKSTTTADLMLHSWIDMSAQSRVAETYDDLLTMTRHLKLKIHDHHLFAHVVVWSFPAEFWPDSTLDHELGTLLTYMHEAEMLGNEHTP